MSILGSRQVATDEEAKQALQDFFQAVYVLDGPVELLRIYESFYLQCHGARPDKDWSDRLGPGSLKVDITAKAASSGAD